MERGGRVKDKVAFIAPLRRGFTLTEVTIVIGIVGLLIGAIWVAASRVKIAYYSNILGNDISYIATQYATSSAFGVADFPTSATCSPYDCTGNNGIPLIPTQICYWCTATLSASNTAALSGMVPLDMFHSTTSPLPLQNKFGGTLNIETYAGTKGTAPGTTSANLGYLVTIDVGMIPTAACIRLLTTYGVGLMSKGMVQVGFDNGAVNEWFGTDTSAMQALITPGCTVSDPVDVGLSFAWPLQSS